MSRRLLALPVALLLLPAGCFKSNARREAVRPHPADPAAARGVAPSRPQLPSPIARTPDAAAPVVKLPGADPAAPPPLLAPPVVPTAADLPAEADDRKPLRERIQDRREERKERQKEEEKKAPTLPSPIAPKPTQPTPPAAQATPAPAAAALRAADPADARGLYQRGADRFAKLADYEARLVRREVVAGKDGPTEELVFQFRKQPFTVYMRNVGEAGRGREVLYVQGKFEDKIHVITGDGDNRLVGSGFRVSVKPDSSMATARSRRKITEAGVGNALARFGRAVEAGRAKPLGKVTRKEYPYPLDAAEVVLRPGDDPGMPNGGKQLVFFDPNPDSAGYALPVLMIGYEGDREVEYNCLDRFRAPAGFADADFHPDRLGKKK